MTFVSCRCHYYCRQKQERRQQHAEFEAEITAPLFRWCSLLSSCLTVVCKDFRLKLIHLLSHCLGGRPRVRRCHAVPHTPTLHELGPPAVALGPRLLVCISLLLLVVICCYLCHSYSSQFGFMYCYVLLFTVFMCFCVVVICRYVFLLFANFANCGSHNW